jgi:O-antigen/teichoic acid export membrane protein
MWAFAGKASTALLTLAVNAFITRLLTPDEVGTYFLMLSLVTVLSLITLTGINKAIVRLISESQARKTPRHTLSIIRSSYFIVGITTLLVLTLFMSGIGKWISQVIFSNSLGSSLIMLTAIWIVANTCSILLAETFRGFHDIRHASIFDGLMDSLIFAILLSGLLVYHGTGSLDMVVWLAIAANSVNLIVASIFLRKKLDKTGIASGPEQANPSEILAIAWPMCASGVTIAMLGQADLWVMGIFWEQHDVGVYGAVKRLVALVTISLLITNAVIPPLIAELNAHSKKDVLENTLRATTTVAAIPALFVLGVFALFADRILATVYGEFYAAGSAILLILSLGQLVNVWCGSCGNVLMMTGHQVLMLKISMISGILAVLLALLLAPEYGGTGVAGSMSTGIMLQNILMLLAVRRHLGIWTHLDTRLIWTNITRSRIKQT